MPLVMVCGQPCSGKSSLAGRLAQLFAEAGAPAVLVDESVLNMDKNAAYAVAAAEKDTRAAFKAEVDRRLSRKAVVILDSLNNIKGFRYELWCIARSAATRSCVLHADAPAEMCRQWNAARESADAYSPAVFDDLAGRFERPDTRSRWDSPLFETQHEDPESEAVLWRVVSAALGRPAGLAAAGDAVSAKAQPVARAMQPNLATLPPQQAATNLLGDIDRAAQAVIGAIMTAQTASGGAAGAVDFGEGEEQRLVLTEPVSLPELRRHKRGFMKLATQSAFSQIRAESATHMFVSYLRGQLE